MRQHLHIEESQIADMCLDLYKEYGTTMAGLKVFTNSDKAHVEEGLHRLGLQGCFEGVICFEILNHCNGLRQFQNSTLFPDETSRNIASGKAAGFHTVIVGGPTLVLNELIKVEIKFKMHLYIFRIYSSLLLWQ